jgi:hypothetical protein
MASSETPWSPKIAERPFCTWRSDTIKVLHATIDPPVFALLTPWPLNGSADP